jgi:hypothetical protein
MRQIWRERNSAYEVFVESVGRRRPFARPRSGWEDNITTCIKEIDWKDAHCIDLSQDTEKLQPVVNMDMNLQVPQNDGNFLTS